MERDTLVASIHLLPCLSECDEKPQPNLDGNRFSVMVSPDGFSSSRHQAVRVLEMLSLTRNLSLSPILGTRAAFAVGPGKLRARGTRKCPRLSYHFCDVRSEGEVLPHVRPRLSFPSVQVAIAGL
jgi:hypothetical protein